MSRDGERDGGTPDAQSRVTRFILPARHLPGPRGRALRGLLHSPREHDALRVARQAGADFSLPALGVPGLAKGSARQALGIERLGHLCAACRDEHPVLLDNRAPRRSAADRTQLARRGSGRLPAGDAGRPYAATAVDREGRTAIEFGLYGAPETFFIDAKGFVQYRHVGPMTPENLGSASSPRDCRRQRIGARREGTRSPKAPRCCC